MYIKITIPKHFQLKLIPNIWNLLFLKKGDVHYIGGAEILPPFGGKGGKPLYPNAGWGGVGARQKHTD